MGIGFAPKGGQSMLHIGKLGLLMKTGADGADSNLLNLAGTAHGWVSSLSADSAMQV